MADQRVTKISRIVDGTTLTQALGVDASGRITVASVAVSVTPGTGAAHLGKAEDEAHTSGDVGVMSLVVRQDAAAQLAGADGDYSPLINDATGLLWTRIGAALPAGSASIGSIISITTSITPGTAAGNLGKAEDAVHASGDVGVMALGVRNDALVALSGTDGDYTPLATDAQGHLQVDILSGASGVPAPTNPTTDITNLTTPVNLAAGASGNADSGSLDGKYLRQVVISGSVSFKAILATVDDATIVNKAVFFGGPEHPIVYNPPSGFIQAPAAATGTQGFRVVLVNEDTSETADFYVTFFAADNI